jgi:hypothetical protein
VARALSRAALIDAYFVGTLVVSGYVWSPGEPADEAARQVHLLNLNLCSLAANFADAGFTPVIDVVLPGGGQLDTLAPLNLPNLQVGLVSKCGDQPGGPPRHRGSSRFTVGMAANSHPLRSRAWWAPRPSSELR